jgi:secondary thiamine-phosphate synthase enzyme
MSISLKRIAIRHNPAIFYTHIKVSLPGRQPVKRRALRYMMPVMRFHTEYLTFRTTKHREYLNITPQVEKALASSGIQEGMILVSAMHITAGVWVNDAEDGLLSDIDEWLEKLAPFRRDYRHHQTGESNGDSHLKSLLVHHQVIVPVTAGKLDFGPWQQIYYAEFDGQRSKKLIIKVMGE